MTGSVIFVVRLLLLEEQTQKFQAEGQVVLCGDFNDRCGGLRDVGGGMVGRWNVVIVKNEQGEKLMVCMRAQVYALSMVDRGLMSLLASPAKDYLWLTTAWCHVKRWLT